ncbi:hypothetical protein [Haploplasma modicum]|jgi:hypothetical protein|uniref:hypothetical protein n=1 Tax=Haploplasma modicum TaxID=2150 RepID=UPI000B0365C9|nr:hypothetical protein [Haploplasma modicum]MCR1809096.1 hypothetical protein [Haploplasma modicum]
MQKFKKVLSYIIDPFQSFGLGNHADKLTKNTNTKKIVVYVLSLLVALVVVYLEYFRG